MHIIFFSHPHFLPSQSMPRYTNWLMEGMKERGHSVELWQPQAKFYDLPVPNSLKKWMGYIDQYIVFPQNVRKQLRFVSENTLFVLTDHALGPWAPLVARRPHVVHCHDFLAQRSALGEIAENRTSWTGRQYQAYIWRGYSSGKNFISVSKKTQSDLQLFLPHKVTLSEVAYNGLPKGFLPANDIVALRNDLQHEVNLALMNGYLLHVGGNQWYKNRMGVIDIYDAWRNRFGGTLPLLLVGAAPSQALTNRYNQSPFKTDIHFLTGISDIVVKRLYAAATVFVFPSLAEGFGWPIIEAMASGCPVITTAEQPMTEVAGKAAFFIRRFVADSEELSLWANHSANVVDEVIHLTREEREFIVREGKTNADKFDSSNCLDSIESIYKRILKEEVVKI